MAILETIICPVASIIDKIIPDKEARAQGFRVMLAIHPAQVAPINEAFTPSAEELARARRGASLCRQSRRRRCGDRRSDARPPALRAG